jgi:hypothetical protein
VLPDYVHVIWKHSLQLTGHFKFDSECAYWVDTQTDNKIWCLHDIFPVAISNYRHIHAFLQMWLYYMRKQQLKQIVGNAYVSTMMHAMVSTSSVS